MEELQPRIPLRIFHETSNTPHRFSTNRAKCFLEPKEDSMTKPHKTDHRRYSDPRLDIGLHSAPYTNKIDNPEFWRLRANEVRSIADNMKLVEAKAIMTGIAEDYEGMAKLVEQQLRERKPKPTDVFEALGAENLSEG
jgi:hypothetical protein